jgi:hypothetical protein
MRAPRGRFVCCESVRPQAPHIHPVAGPARRSTMAKGQEKKATNNKPKLSVKEKKAKKKEKAASK